MVSRVRVVGAASARVAGEHEHGPRRVGGVLVAPRDRDLPRLQRLAQGLHDVAGEQRELVEEQHPEMGLAHLARSHPAAAAAEDARARGRVVRRSKRWPDEPRGTSRQRPGQGVHRGELQRLVVGEVGQQPGDPLRERRLARALGTGEHQVVSARGGDLEGVARILHPDHVGHVEVLEPLLAAPRQQRRSRHRLDLGSLGDVVVALQQSDHLAQGADPEDPHARHHRCLGRLRLGHVDGVDPARRRRHRHRQHARDAAHPAVEGELPDHGRRVGERRAGQVLVGGPEDRDRDAQVEVGTTLGQVGRGEQDRDAPGVRPREPAVDDRRPAAVASLGDRRVGPTDQGRPDQSVGQVDLHVDHVTDGSLERHRVGGGDHQPTPRTCSISAAPRSASSTPTRSIRIPPG